MARHFKTDRLLGFATVEFCDKSSVKKILNAKEHIINGKKVKCKVKLLKAEIDEKRSYEKSKYNQSNRTNSNKFAVPKSKTLGTSDSSSNKQGKIFGFFKGKTEGAEISSQNFLMKNRITSSSRKPPAPPMGDIIKKLQNCFISQKISREK